MHWDLFSLEDDDDLYEDILDNYEKQNKNIRNFITFTSTEIKTDVRESINDIKNETPKTANNIDTPKEEPKEDTITYTGTFYTNNKMVVTNFILLFSSFLIKGIVKAICGIEVSNIVSLVFIAAMLINTFIGVMKIKNKINEDLKESQKDKVKLDPKMNDKDDEELFSTKKEYKGINSIKEELIGLRKQLETQFNTETGEMEIVDQIINQCLNLLDRIKNLQYAFKIILERSEEYSLDEVIETLHQAEDNIGRNIFNISNRLILELNIKGFDKKQINEYLQNNEDIVDGSTELVKEALDYIENKENLDNNIIGIETLTETIQYLKKHLK